jgi:phosphoglycolate phosphatase
LQRKFDLVIFDLDGTLIDGRMAIRENFNHALKSLGLPQVEDERIDAMIGTPLVEMFERTIPPTSRYLASRLVEIFAERYTTTGHIGTKVLNGVIPTLEKLRECGFKLAVVTSKEDDRVRPLLERIELHRYFDLVTGRREGMRNKPHADMIKYVLKELDVDPQKTVLVGDTPLDVMTARNAGIYVIAVTSSIDLGIATLDGIRKSNPGAIISSLLELPADLCSKR